MEKPSEMFIELKSFSGPEYSEMEMPDIRILMNIVRIETVIDIKFGIKGNGEAVAKLQEELKEIIKKHNLNR